MNIAIIGAGFQGVALSYYLSSENYHAITSITIFDSVGVGAGASGIAAGLVHPYAGKKANLSRFGNEAFQESSHLLEQIHHISKKNYSKPVIIQRGIVRPISSQDQEKDYLARSQENLFYPVLYITADVSSELYLNPLHIASLYISCGLAIDSPQYLTALFSASQASNKIHFVQKRIGHLSEIEPYFDYIFICTGYEAKNLIHIGENIILNQVKGQKIAKEIPANMIVPQVALSGSAYAVFQQRSIYLGATYEHHFCDLAPSWSFAEKEIMKKISLFWPQLQTLPTMSVIAAARATTPTSCPLVVQKSHRTFAITGLGSKGLLYHAWLAKHISQAFYKQHKNYESMRSYLQRTLTSSIYREIE